MIFDFLEIYPTRHGNFAGMKDQRYAVVKTLLESNKLSSLEQFLTIVPKTVVRTDMGWSYDAMTSKVKKPENITFKDVLKLSAIIECEPLGLIQVILSDIQKQQKQAKPKNKT